VHQHGDQLLAITDPIAERARKIGGTTPVLPYRLARGYRSLS